MATYFLGVDNGGTVAKAGVFLTDGKEIAVASRKTETFAPQPGHAERDVEKMWEATAAAIKEAVEKSGVAAADIACVACTGHGNGLYMVDSNGQPVYNGIMSTDNRAQDYVTKWCSDGTWEKVLPKTCQALWPATSAALMAWMNDNEPEVVKKAAHVLMCKDFIRSRLTGEFYGEITDYSGANLTNVPEAKYDQSILDAFGIGNLRDILPPLKRSADLCGKITAKAAAKTGLAEGTPVAGGMFDIDACGLACGIVDESQLCMISGTWGNNQYIAKKPVCDKDFFISSCYCIDGYFLMLEGSATSASNLEWFVTELLGADRQLAEQEGKSVYDVCNAEVAQTKPDDPNITFLPFLYGSNADPNAKATFVGLNAWHKRGHLLRAIYEGVVFSHRTHLDRLLKFRDYPKSIRLAGGAARSVEWVQIFADCFQVPVEIPAGTELGALGAAVCAAVAVGYFDNYADAMVNMARVGRTQEPNCDLKDVYAEKFDQYHKIINALSPVW